MHRAQTDLLYFYFFYSAFPLAISCSYKGPHCLEVARFEAVPRTSPMGMGTLM